MVENEFQEPDTNVLSAMNNAQKNVVEACRDRDITTTWLIQICIKESNLLWISGANSTYQDWNFLASFYKGIDRVNKVRL